MKKGLIISITAAIFALAAISCNKADSTLRYNNVTMGNVTKGVFTSDQGNIFIVTEQNCPGKLDTMKRAFIICDVLREMTDAQYDIRLKYVANVLTKEAVAISEIEDLETYMNDPLIVSDLWISGGYMNMLITVPVVSGSKKVHEINLLHEIRDGVYKFRLRHDAQGEILTEKSDRSQFVLSGAYVSFPINTIIKEDSAQYVLEWNGYVINGNTITAQTKAESVSREYIKSSFEHAPAPSTAALSIE